MIEVSVKGTLKQVCKLSGAAQDAFLKWHKGALASDKNLTFGRGGELRLCSRDKGYRRQQLKVVFV